MTIESFAVAFVAATKKRAQARSHLSALRKKWHEETGRFFDKWESDGEEGYEDMMAALHDREQANAEYRRAKSRLFRACTPGVPASGDMRAEFKAWVESQGCDTDGAWSAWQGCWNLLHTRGVMAPGAGQRPEGSDA